MSQNPKLSVDDQVIVERLLLDGYSLRQIALHLNTNHNNICRAMKRWGSTVKRGKLISLAPRSV